MLLFSSCPPDNINNCCVFILNDFWRNKLFSQLVYFILERQYISSSPVPKLEKNSDFSVMISFLLTYVEDDRVHIKGVPFFFCFSPKKLCSRVQKEEVKIIYFINFNTIFIHNTFYKFSDNNKIWILRPLGDQTRSEYELSEFFYKLQCRSDEVRSCYGYILLLNA